MLDFGKIPEEQKSSLVIELLHTIGQMAGQIEQLRQEVARLKKHKGKPKIPPSKLDKDPKDEHQTDDNQENKSKKKRPGSSKRSKTKQLIIHEMIPIFAAVALANQPSIKQFYCRV